MEDQKIHNTCFTCFACGEMIHGIYQKKNGHNYHSSCVDNSHFRERQIPVDVR